MAAEPYEDAIIWHSPDWRAPAQPAPLMVHEWADLLGHCRASLARRRAAYPAMVEAATLTQSLADQDIAAWQLLEREWLWIVTGAGTPPPPGSLGARMAAVDLAVVRVRQAMEKGDRGHEMCRQSHLVQALRWHLAHVDAHAEPLVHAAARFNHARRAEQAQRFCGTCERWQADPATRACTSTDCGLGAGRLPQINERAA